MLAVNKPDSEPIQFEQSEITESCIPQNAGLCPAVGGALDFVIPRKLGNKIGDDNLSGTNITVCL